MVQDACDFDGNLCNLDATFWKVDSAASEAGIDNVAATANPTRSFG